MANSRRARSAPAWLGAVVAGAPEAVDGFCREQHPAVFRLCLGFLASAADAEDAAQDAIVHLLDRIGQYDAKKPFEAWRNAVVLNLCRDRQRRSRRRSRTAVGRECPDERTSAAPEEGLERGELRALLERALAALPPREREAFVLRELEGIATADVASAMTITTASVRSLLTLARKRLRSLLAERCEGFTPAGCCEKGGRRG